MALGKICVLLDNAFLPDYRVRNQLNALCAAGYTVDLFAFVHPDLPKEEHIGNLHIYRIIEKSVYSPLGKTYRDFRKGFIEHVSNRTYDLIHAHDFFTIDLGTHLKQAFGKKGQTIPLIYDSHEFLQGYYFYQRIDNWKGRIKGYFVWKHIVRRERACFKTVDRIISVSQSICKKLQAQHNPDKEVVLIRNLPETVTIGDRSENYFNKKYDLPADAKIMIHTGNTHFENSRFIALVKMLRELNVYLVFLGKSKSIDEKKEITISEKLSDRVFFHDKVPREEITRYCSYADIGLIFIWKKNWPSYWYALPNKLMDVTMAGLPVLSTAQLELKKFIETYKSGTTFDGDDSKDFAKAFKELMNNYDHYASNAKKIKDTLNWDNEKLKLLALYDELLLK